MAEGSFEIDTGTPLVALYAPVGHVTVVNTLRMPAVSEEPQGDADLHQQVELAPGPEIEKISIIRDPPEIGQIVRLIAEQVTGLAPISPQSPVGTVRALLGKYNLVQDAAQFKQFQKDHKRSPDNRPLTQEDVLALRLPFLGKLEEQTLRDEVDEFIDQLSERLGLG